MEKAHSNDLFDFMLAATNEMAAEYQRIQKRAREDPGTAGDEGEENWAAVLRQWLPPAFQVVTKGRIMGHDGRASPQVDILVLTPSYPRFLLNKKIYLAGGVAAVFECKITLRSSHLPKITETSALIKSLASGRTGTPYRDLHSPILYGVLAHSHAWKNEAERTAYQVKAALAEADERHIDHPSKSVDVTCVADLATWACTKIAYAAQLTQIFERDGRTCYSRRPTDISATSCIMQHAFGSLQYETFTPIGSMLAYVVERLAWEDANLRPLAEYFRLVHLGGSGVGGSRYWDAGVFSERTRSLLSSREMKDSGGDDEDIWDEWGHWFP